MFFFGIFGVQFKEKEIGYVYNRICRKCSCMTTYKVIKSYNFFHIFFIPLFKWGQRYFLKSRCCGSIFEIPVELGREFEKNKDIYIKDEDLTEVYDPYTYNNMGYKSNKVCKKCGEILDESFKYCPNCGEKLS